MVHLSETQLAEVRQMVAKQLQKNPRAFAEKHFGFFCSYYLSAHFDAGFSDFQYPLFKILSGLVPGQNLLLLIAREHGKSTLITFAYVLYLVCYRKKRFIVLPSAVQDTAEKFLASIKSELESNARIRRDFGDLIGDDEIRKSRNKRVWRASSIHTSNYVVVMTTSTQGTVRGLVQNLPEDLVRDRQNFDSRTQRWTYVTKITRPDLLILDDIVNDAAIGTLRVRQKLWDWFWKNAYSAQGMGEGNVLIVGTTVHDDDFVCRMWAADKQTPGLKLEYGQDIEKALSSYPGRPPWIKLKFPACDPSNPFDSEGRPNRCLFPEKWGRLDYNRPVQQTDRDGKTVTKYFSYLYWRSVELGPAFNPEFLMLPISRETRYFDLSHFMEYVLPTAEVDPRLFQAYAEINGKQLEYLPKDLIAVTAVDPAATDETAVKRNTDPDYTVVVTWGFSPSRQRFYMLGLHRSRCKPGEILQQLLVHCQLFNAQFGGRYYPDAQKDPSLYYNGWPCQHLGVAIETVAFQKVLVTLFEELCTVLGFYPVVFEMNRGQGRGKTLRAFLPAHLSQQRLLSLPYQFPGRMQDDILALRTEFEKFPSDEVHDDTVDASVDAITLLYMYSLQLGRGLLGMDAVKFLLQGGSDFTVDKKYLDRLLRDGQTRPIDRP